ncbi:MAG: hypothetical protein HGA53_05585 [Anaerolineaceae bacterium]|nr:hypothetical protein [Anaerolineaceae bacterium]
MKRPILLSLLTIFLVSCIVISILLMILAGLVLSSSSQAHIPSFDQYCSATVFLTIRL